MDIVFFLVSINKISLLAFLVTLGFLGYEVYLLKKNDPVRTKPKIPNFEENVVITTEQAKNLNDQPLKIVNKSDNPIIIILIVFMFLFGVASLLGFSNLEKETRVPKVSPTPIINIINSKGIRIFDSNLSPISEASLSTVKSGDKIIIGVETVSEVDIDRARIRVNSDRWETNNITLDFDKKLNIYYSNYIVASNQGQLKIEAQLHSQTDGWLGD